MPLLSDQDINQLLRAEPSLIENFNPAVLGTPGSPVRGASLELTVGEIFLAGTKIDELGGVDKPRTEISLSRGQTAVVRTQEKLRLPPTIAGIAFPPSKDVSLAGLLTTNPGLIDPDYSGHLHLTVVNMGREVFGLARGERILRVMLFQLATPAMRKVGEAPPAVDQELLARLSHDFMDVDRRADEIARNVVAEAEIRIKSRQVWVPLFGTVVGGLFAVAYYIYSGHAELKAEVAKAQGQISNMSSLMTLGAVDERLRALQSIETRLRAVETTVQSQAAPSQTVPAAPQRQ